MYTLNRGVHTTYKERLTSSAVWVTGTVISILSISLVIGVWSVIAHPALPAPSIGTAIQFKPVAFVSHQTEAMQAPTDTSGQFTGDQSTASANDMMASTPTMTIAVSTPSDDSATPNTSSVDSSTPVVTIGGMGGGVADGTTDTPPQTDPTTGLTDTTDGMNGTNPPADSSSTDNSSPLGSGILITLPPIIVEPVITTPPISISL